MGEQTMQRSICSLQKSNFKNTLSGGSPRCESKLDLTKTGLTFSMPLPFSILPLPLPPSPQIEKVSRAFAQPSPAQGSIPGGKGKRKKELPRWGIRVFRGRGED